eukprot:gene12858-350_t
MRMLTDPAAVTHACTDGVRAPGGACSSHLTRTAFLLPTFTGAAAAAAADARLRDERAAREEGHRV